MKAWLALAIVLLSAGSAGAESRAEERAREHYRRGMASYHLADFEGAIHEFKKAYELTQASALLFNLAQASRLNKEPERALFYYRSYLRMVPRPANREDVEQLIVWCEGELRRTAAPPPPTLASVGAIVEDSRDRIVIPPPPALRPDHSRRNLAIGAAVIGSLGVGALVGGVVLGVRAQQAESEITRTSQEEDRWSARHEALYNEGRREAAAATAMYVVGGVSLATGVVLAIVGARRGAPRIEPTLARRSAVTLGWEF